MTWTTPELAPLPLLTTTPHQRKDVSALDRFDVHPLHGGSLVVWARARDKASHGPIPIPLGYRGHTVSSEEFVEVYDDNECIASIMAHKDILVFAQSISLMQISTMKMK
ncbi:hypothetical protein TNCV_3868951 [Trichonephila clavipes]|nr:hypothetical protein TNCV_3868951 [Trichonephila clavipes]